MQALRVFDINRLRAKQNHRDNSHLQLMQIFMCCLLFMIIIQCLFI